MKREKLWKLLIITSCYEPPKYWQWKGSHFQRSSHMQPCGERNFFSGIANKKILLRAGPWSSGSATASEAHTPQLAPAPGQTLGCSHAGSSSCRFLPSSSWLQPGLCTQLRTAQASLGFSQLSILLKFKKIKHKGNSPQTKNQCKESSSFIHKDI